MLAAHSSGKVSQGPKLALFLNLELIRRELLKSL